MFVVDEVELVDERSCPGRVKPAAGGNDTASNFDYQTHKWALG
jgi:hypothetical protein